MVNSTGSTRGPLYRKGSISAVQLGARLGGGGEGEVWELLDDPVRVLKMYRKPNADRGRKLESMLAAVPDDPQRRRNHVSICWPEELVVDGAGTVAGYIMPRMDLDRFKPAALYWDAHDRAVRVPGFTWKYLCVGAANIASVVDMIHGRGHVIGDLNDENFLLSESALATVVDCDSMQIRCPNTGEMFRSLVTREPYLSPEWMGKKLADHDRTAADDNWALAVLVFQLLMEGQHPANGVGFPEERRDRIRQGIFPMLGVSGFQLPRDAHPLTVLSPELQALARRCFEDGFSNPDSRPTAHEWKTALNSFAGSLHQCTQVGEHWYGAHSATCLWCDEKSQKGYDRFAFHALASGIQTKLPPAASSLSTASAASGGISSVSASTAVQTQTAPSGTPRASRVLGAVFAIMATIIVTMVVLLSGGSSNKSTESSTASSSSPSTYVQPSVSSGALTAAQEPAASQATTANNVTSEPAAVAPQQTVDIGGKSYPLLDQSMAVPAIPYQPASSGVALPFRGTHISLSYPSNWTAKQQKDGVTVSVCQDGASRTMTNGDMWCYYNASFGIAGSPEGQNLNEAQILDILRIGSVSSDSRLVSTSATTNLEGGGLQVSQTVQSPFGYVEENRFFIWPLSGNFAWSYLAAPQDQWNTAIPILENIYSSARFY